KLGERLRRALRANPLIPRYRLRLGPAPDCDRDDLGRERPALPRPGRPLVALGREPVLIGPRDRTLVRDVLGRIPHRAVLEGAPQAVADQGIDQLPIAVLESRAGPLDQIRGATHALHPARGDNLRVPGLNPLGREHDRLEPGPAHLFYAVR